MFDTTQRSKIPYDPSAELQHLSPIAAELAERLRAHGDALAQRGMTTPQGAQENLRGVSTSLQAVLGQLDGMQTELQHLRELARTTEIINSLLDLDLVLDDVIDTVISLTASD